MNLKQNDLEHLQDMMQRVLLVVSKVPAQVRSALNAAVKRGELGHMKKDGHKPEVYYNPTFEYLPKQERKSHEQSVLNAVANVAGWR